jgi:hypothetical protein
LSRLDVLTPYLPILTLWIAVFAIASLVLREFGAGRIRRYPLTVFILSVSLMAIPAGGLFKATRPYHRRLRAMLFKEKSPAIQQSGCAIFPANNIWNRRIADLPADAATANYVRSMGADAPLHPDFGPVSGIPYSLTNGRESPAEVTFGEGAGESDRGAYRIPDNAAVEPASDSHVLVLNTGECVLYEFFRGKQQGSHQWFADSAAIFNLRSNTLRPLGWTSADAAGLPILPGLIRYDEVAAGRIPHAVRFTTRRTRRAYVWPATHFASQTNDAQLPAMGQRFRLRASFDTGGFSPQARIILAALKEYGMILSDNGGNWFLSGAPDSRWSNQLTAEFRNVHGADFESVDVSPLMIRADSGEARP